MNYYRALTNNGLHSFQDVPAMYGADVRGIFRSLFRQVFPLLQWSLEIFKLQLGNVFSITALSLVSNHENIFSGTAVQFFFYLVHRQ